MPQILQVLAWSVKYIVTLFRLPAHHARDNRRPIGRTRTAAAADDTSRSSHARSFGHREIQVLSVAASPRPTAPTSARMSKCSGGVRSARSSGSRSLQPSAAHPDHPILSTRPCPITTHYQLHSGLYTGLEFLAERESFSSGLRRAFFGAGLRLNAHRTLALRAEASILAGPLRPKLMVFSTMLRDELVGIMRAPERYHRCSPPGVNLRLFHPAPPGTAARSHAGRNELRLLFVGHNFALKGLRCVIDALVRLQASGVNANLVVAGRGHEARYRRMARRPWRGRRHRFRAP